MSYSCKTLRRLISRRDCISSLSTFIPESVRVKIPRTKVKSILESNNELIGNEILVQGWIRTIRSQKMFSFLELNDGSALAGLQIIANEDLPSYSVLTGITTGAAMEITGKIVESKGAGQKYELVASSLKVVGECPGDEYPLQKKRHSLEFLRSIAHLRARTNTLSSVARVRSALSFATHEFFHSQGFHQVHTPLITSSDCEGAGEMFRVTSLPIDSPDNIPRSKDGSTNFDKDFFGKPAYLTVSGQLSAETFACALGDVYTFGPTFRAEQSQTSRHLAEFHMIEPEMAFADLNDAMNNAEQFVKYIVKKTRQECSPEMAFFEKFVDKTLTKRLDKLVNEPFVRMSYSSAIEILQKEIAKDPSKWAYPNVSFGTDLQSEHERWLAEKKFNACVFLHNYPKSIKPFYMRDNDDGVTVDSFDLLVPGVGELIGGSQREERLEVLEAKLASANMNKESYWWYLDLRRYGSVPHAGYGLGFERLVCYVTGIENIRDAIEFPRTVGNAEF